MGKVPQPAIHLVSPDVKHRDKVRQFAQVLARIKAAFEADGFNPKEAKNIIESVKHDVLNGMMQIVEVKPKGRMLFEDFLTSYIEDMETGRRTKKGRTVKVSPAYIKGLRIIQKQIRNYQKETHRKLGLDDMTMETRNSLVGYWKERGLMPNAINSYMTDVRTVAKAAYEDKLTKCDDFRHSDFVPKKEEVDNIYLTPEQIQEMLDLDLSTKEAVRKRLESLDISEDEKLAQLSKCRITHIRTLEHVRDIFIVGCLTGQRVSDYSRICEDMITEIGGTEFILITQQKTEKKVYIPVDRRVRAILAKYDGKLPPVHPNEMNKLVKTIGLLLGWTHDCGFDEKRLNPKRGRRFCDHAPFPYSPKEFRHQRIQGWRPSAFHPSHHGTQQRGAIAPLPETGRGGKGRHSVKGFQGYHQNIRKCLWKNQGLTLLATCSSCPT